MKTNDILDILEEMYPNAECELIHKNAFELAVAVVLSAQTTDVAVNKITPNLFKKYSTPKKLAEAPIEDIEHMIKTIGLYHNKAKSIQGLAFELLESFDGEMPRTLEELITLPGVGRKSANVILSVCYGIPAIAVDTHVERIAKRLNIAKKQDTVLQVEKKCMKKIDQNRWNRAHHLFIFFGRYFCTARNPKCNECPFFEICTDTKIKKVQVNKL